MEYLKSHIEDEPSKVNPEAYIGKRFLRITTEQIAQLPDGTAIRPFVYFFHPAKAIIVDQGTREWLTRQEQRMDHVYGFLETDQIPMGIQFNPNFTETIQSRQIRAEDLPSNHPDNF